LNVGPTGEGIIPPEAVGILERIGRWYNMVRESFEDVVPASHLTANRNILITRRWNTMYVHLHREPVSEVVKLKPINVTPRRAILLNNGESVEFAVNMVPSDHTEQKKYLRLRKLPVNEMSNTVLIVKLEFDDLTAIENLQNKPQDKNDIMKR